MARNRCVYTLYTWLYPSLHHWTEFQHIQFQQKCTGQTFFVCFSPKKCFLFFQYKEIQYKDFFFLWTACSNIFFWMMSHIQLSICWSFSRPLSPSYHYICLSDAPKLADQLTSAALKLSRQFPFFPACLCYWLAPATAKLSPSLADPWAYPDPCILTWSDVVVTSDWRN